MKVLQINSFFSVGGPPRIVNGIYDTLKEQGHECKIAAAREAFYAPEDSWRIGSGLDVKFNGVMARIFDNEGFNAKKATRELVKRIEEYDPDIIHLHNLHGYCINVEILFDYLKRADKKVFWTLHDCWAFTGHCAYFSMSGCDKWQTKCFICPQKHSYPASLLFSNAERNFERKNSMFTGVRDMTIVTPSQWLVDLVGRSFLKEYPVKVVHNGIDTSVFKPTESDIRGKYKLENKKIVLGVAQVWDKRKGLDDFIKLSKVLDESYKIVLVGLSEKQVAQLPDNIIKITRTKNATELAQWYTAADLFVNTTYEDNYPTVNLEAQACGTPAVTYRTGGSPESVPASHVVGQGDIDALVSLIKEICSKDSPEVKDASNYERKTRYAEYIELYRSDEAAIKEKA